MSIPMCSICLEVEWLAQKPKYTEEQWLKLLPEGKGAYLKKLRQNLQIEKNRLKLLENELQSYKFKIETAYTRDQWALELALGIVEDQIKDCLKRIRSTSGKLAFDKPRSGNALFTITKTDIQRAKERPIEDYFPSKLRRVGPRLVGVCPFHSEKTGSFTIYTKENRWHCFGACSTGGDSIEFIQKLNNINFIEAVKFLCQKT